jgi:hypothetical protein
MRLPDLIDNFSSFLYFKLEFQIIKPRCVFSVYNFTYRDSSEMLVEAEMREMNDPWFFEAEKVHSVVQCRQ